MMIRKKGDTIKPRIVPDDWSLLTYLTDEAALVDGLAPGEGRAQPLCPDPGLVLLDEAVGGLLAVALAGAVPGHVTSD